ncbi:hypothetical protein [Williamsia sp. M5A3_1d]
MGVTMNGGRGKITVASLAAVVAVVASACGGGDPGGSAASSVAPSVAGVSSVPVPAGVAKDSVLDLNSTKDMTGVVTTVPIGESPYDENMPDICPFIPQSAMDQLGMGLKEKSFSGRKLVTQSCILSRPGVTQYDEQYDATISVNNFAEYKTNPRFVFVRENFQISSKLTGSVIRNRTVDFPPNVSRCEVSWGTFYGTASVAFLNAKSDSEICERAEIAAKVLAPGMPKSPSEMRATS